MWICRNIQFKYGYVSIYLVFRVYMCVYIYIQYVQDMLSDINQPTWKTAPSLHPFRVGKLKNCLFTKTKRWLNKVDQNLFGEMSIIPKTQRLDPPIRRGKWICFFQGVVFLVFFWSSKMATGLMGFRILTHRHHGTNGIFIHQKLNGTLPTDP